MTRKPRLDRPSFDVDRQITRGALKRLNDLLIVRHRADGSPDPGGRARLDIERVLAAAFDNLATHYTGRKQAALDKLLHLQKEALDFYGHVLARTGDPDIPRLEKILKDMDRNFRELARRADDVAKDVPPIVRSETFDPKTRLTTVEYGGGAAAGGSTFVVEPEGTTRSARVAHEGPHPGRAKGSLPDPVGGLVPGEHRGHQGAEGSVADPRVANVVENLISEAAHSNLSPKKRFDNVVAKMAAALPRRVETMHLPRRSKGDVRPHSVTHQILLDGKVVYEVTVPNV